jgi:hypothetical protein
MTPQGYEDNAAYSDRTACVWSVGKVHIMLVSTVEALSSQRVPDLVLSYVFMQNAEEPIS